MGGIPYYLRQFDDHRTLAENIQKQILTRGSILYSEVEFLLRQELRETAVYNVIIQAVAMGNTKLNDIFQKTQMREDETERIFEKYHRSGNFAQRVSCDGAAERTGNIQRGLYQVTDHYFRFWYAFLFPNISELETGDSQVIWEYVVSPELDGFTSHAFEEVCQGIFAAGKPKQPASLSFCKDRKMVEGRAGIGYFSCRRQGEELYSGGMQI